MTNTSYTTADILRARHAIEELREANEGSAYLDKHVDAIETVINSLPSPATKDYADVDENLRAHVFGTQAFNLATGATGWIVGEINGRVLVRRNEASITAETWTPDCTLLLVDGDNLDMPHYTCPSDGAKSPSVERGIDRLSSFEDYDHAGFGTVAVGDDPSDPVVRVKIGDNEWRESGSSRTRSDDDYAMSNIVSYVVARV